MDMEEFSNKYDDYAILEATNNLLVKHGLRREEMSRIIMSEAFVYRTVENTIIIRPASAATNWKDLVIDLNGLECAIDYDQLVIDHNQFVKKQYEIRVLHKGVYEWIAREELTNWELEISGNETLSGNPVTFSVPLLSKATLFEDGKPTHLFFPNYYLASEEAARLTEANKEKDPYYSIEEF